MNLYITKRLAQCIAPAALAISLFSLSCSKEPAYEGARLSVRPETADFGTAQANDPVAFHNVSLTLVNQGKETLEIEDVELPEGFSYTITPRRTISGGAKATLKITMDRRKFSGDVAETAYILSNDATRAKTPVPITAKIEGDSAAPPGRLVDGPDITLDHKTHDFGAMTRDQVLEHSFPFKNTGNKTLKILFIDTRCMCTTARASKREIRPGESAEIIAKLDGSKYPGSQPITKTLRVGVNDPDEPDIALTISARIIDVARVEPEQILLPNVRAGGGASAEARVIQEGPRALIIEEIKTSSPMITVETLPLEGEPAGYLLKIALSPEMPEGKFEERLSIITNYINLSRVKSSGSSRPELFKNYRRLKLSIKGSVGGAVSAAPRSVNFGSAQPGKPQKRKIVVSGANPFTIESASLTSNALKASFAPKETGTRLEVTVEFTPEGPGRQIADTLVIHTTGGDLTVPIYATIESGP